MENLNDELLFELRNGDQRWEIYAGGNYEGFPEGTVINNRALSLLSALWGFALVNSRPSTSLVADEKPIGVVMDEVQRAAIESARIYGELAGAALSGINALSASATRPGAQCVYPVSLSLCRRASVLAGFGRSKQLWVLDCLRKNHQTDSPASDTPAPASELFALAFAILGLAFRSTLERAKIRLRTR
jgi:hypothetical protein